ncbi:serine threonine kinase [Leptolyngbya sp. Heron Island J]|nr:serine threonine kinase [Leptolyngbya sp. Heron Island J]
MSEGQNFARNPLQMVKQSVYKYGILLYGKLSLPTGSKGKETTADSPAELELGHGEDRNTNGADAIGVINNGASHAPFQTTDISSLKPEPIIHQQPTLWQPTLQPGERLQGGWWGVYTIKSCVYAQDWIRRYDGLQDNGSEPVWIYEYCLDEEHWSAEEIDERKRRFKHLIDLNLRLGEGSDFRIVRPKDVIKPAGNRVYLITRPVLQSLTLNEFLTQQPIPWTRSQIERFLSQVLQSLQYLQTYLVNWPGDRWEQKLSHGNLSGDCLWIRLPEGHTELNEHPFFVYLGRFPLWEHLVWPHPMAEHNDQMGSVDDDLQALAHITFDLIRGYPSDDDPANISLWPDDDSMRVLYPYILQILGRGEGFKSIDSALSVLQTLPANQYPVAEPEEPLVEESPVESSSFPSLLLWLLGGGLLLGLMVWFAAVLKPESREFACKLPCRLEDVESLGRNQSLRYGIEQGSSWEKAFFSTLTSPLKAPRPVSQFGEMTELQRTLQERDADFLLEKASNVRIPRNLLFASLRTNSLDTALIQNSPDLPSDLEKRTVGYDGITIFVTHSNAQRQDNIPNRLRGRISLQQLRRVLLDPNAPLDGARVEIYWPEDEVTVNTLRDILFERDADKLIFEQRYNEEQPFDSSSLVSQQRNMYEHMLDDFETNARADNEDIIGIGFNRISRLIGQCSVYPLALVDKGRTHHLFVDAHGAPIDQTTDLCGDKGTYWVNDRLFQPSAVTYPLAYEMAVVYHRPVDVDSCDRYTEGCAKGQLLADKLLTPEGQYLLSEVGLVPVLPISEIRQMVWSSMGQGETP